MSAFAHEVVRLAGGKIVGSQWTRTQSCLDPKFKRPEIRLGLDEIHDFLGFPRDSASLGLDQVEAYWKGLGLEVVRGADQWRVRPPTYRWDLNLKEDLAEEVARSIGYDQIPSTIPGLTSVPALEVSSIPQWTLQNRAKDSLVRQGLQETLNYAFTSQESLSRTIFPLGGLRKSEIYEMATRRGFVELVNKSESYEICFVPDNDYRGFLKRNIPDLEARVEGGDFILSNGKKVGKHRGYPFYTIGQRKGLEVTFGKPMFVTQIIPETNTVVLGEAEELQESNLTVKGINMVKYAHINEPMAATTKIRYRDPGAESILTPVGNDVEVSFVHHVTGIAPGQSAVFYEGDDVIGGGIIQRKSTI
jgi:hypothetical protein